MLGRDLGLSWHCPVPEHALVLSCPASPLASGARGMFLGLKDCLLKLVIWRFHLSNVLSCSLQKYDVKITKHGICVCIFA